MSGPPLLEVRDLSVSFRTQDGTVHAVDGVSFTVNRGEVLGIVGESGSGKSVTAMTLMRLILDQNAVFSGEVLFKGRDLMQLSQRDMLQVRGQQDRDDLPGSDDVAEPRLPGRLADRGAAARARGHVRETGAQAHARAARRRRHPQPRRPAIDDYPHQFSGGMRQRVMIAMGLSCNPDVLIADEPTTALDVTIQAQILELIGSLQREFDSAVVLITHDLGVVAEVADRVAVMYAGRIVEYAEVGELFRGPQHPYTWGLLGSISRLDRPRQRRLAAITGQPPSLISLPAGCSFRPRCPYAFDRCRAERP